MAQCPHHIFGGNSHGLNDFRFLLSYSYNFADLSRVSWTVDHGKKSNTKKAIWLPRSRGQKRMTLLNHVLYMYISCLCTFRVHLLCHSWFLWWLPLFSTFWSLLWTGFSLWLIFEKWRNEVLNRVIFFWAGRKQKRVYTVGTAVFQVFIGYILSTITG